MRILFLAALMLLTGFSGDGVFTATAVFAQSDGEGGDKPRDGRGSGCGHGEKEETVS